jgi:tetratricopeptide (TPR) repeat protein
LDGRNRQETDMPTDARSPTSLLSAALIAMSLSLCVGPVQAAGADASGCDRIADQAAKIAACTSIIDAAGENDKARAAALHSRAQAHLAKGDNDSAIADLDRAIEVDPSNANMFIARGNAYKNKAEPDRAIADYGEAIRLAPAGAQPRQHLPGQEGLRFGHRRLRRGPAARSQIRRRLQQSRERLSLKGRQ